MGIIRGGILGGFRKKAGAVIGSYWRSLDVIKGLPRISGKAATAAQLDQRAKFGLGTNFLSYVKDLIEIGYKVLSDVETPMNVAVSYHIKEAITGVSPNFVMDYPKVMFSQGKLKLPWTIEMETIVPAEIGISWIDSGDDGLFKEATDRLTVMVYNPAKDDFVTVKNVAARSVETYTLHVPIEYSGDNVHVYVSFNSISNPLLVSKSYYVGAIAIL